jgi:hypothetical protein
VFIPWARLAELLRRPRGCRVVGDRDMHDTTTLVSENHEDEQESIGRSRNHEEIGGGDLP